ncbi:prephenate dehydratase [Verrucomicrobia bacterium LW23]|nr:prephenate dehydratase [Verrucomicrobia bacterium LW23]
MSILEVAYLGPAGSFSHLVAKKRFPEAAEGSGGAPVHYVNLPTIPDVIEYVQARPGSRGIVPIENSSAGFLLDTIDMLINPACTLRIQGELSMHIRLALLGRAGETLKRVYSHHVPLLHCGPWLRAHHPEAEHLKALSTSEAARIVSRETQAAAIANREAAELYGLDVLAFPIDEQRVNLTQFFLIGHGEATPAEAAGLPREISLAAAVKNQVGSLVEFLMPFQNNGVNLKRIMSRPISGQPNHYIFFVSAEADVAEPRMAAALEQAGIACEEIRVLGSYPRVDAYFS